MRVLFSPHVSLSYMYPPQISKDQIIAGPKIPSIRIKNKCRFFWTVQSRWDIAAFVERLPAKERPDLVVVKADASRANMPYNISGLKVPSVLILGDTQHMRQPLNTMITYVTRERYTYYFSDHKRHHLHFFRDAGLANAHWLPGVFVTRYKPVRAETSKYLLSFVGGMGKAHPCRRDLVEAIRGFPSDQCYIGQAPQEQTLDIFAESEIVINQSLNGDLNLRTFEVLAGGSVLLSDRLAKQSGLYEILEDGEEFVTYDDLADLQDKIKWLDGNRDYCRRVAKKGRRRFDHEHSQERKVAKIIAAVERGEINPAYHGGQDKRCQPAGYDLELLLSRIECYEYLQELHRTRISGFLVFSAGSDPVNASDAVDLHRFQVYAIGENGREAFGKWDVIEQIQIVDRARGHKLLGNATCAVINRNEVADFVRDSFWSRKPERVFITGFSKSDIGSKPHLLAKEEMSRSRYQVDGKHETAFVLDHVRDKR